MARTAQARTAAVLPKLLAMLKARHLRVVHVVPAGRPFAPPALVAHSPRLHSPDVVLDGAAPGHKDATRPPRARPVLARNSFETIFTGNVRR